MFNWRKNGLRNNKVEKKPYGKQGCRSKLNHKRRLV